MLESTLGPPGLIMAYLSPLPIYAVFALAYRVLSPKFETERKRAYILSTMSSFTMTLVSLPFLWTYLRYGMETVFEEGQKGWMGGLARFGVVFFGTYLFADVSISLTIGYFHYRSQVGLLTGWIHHVVYIGLMIYLSQTRQSPVFLIASIMELPTFDLAISNLFPIVRNDLRFLSSFFVIRIAFHLGYLLDCLRPTTRAVTDSSWVPTIMLSLAFILHAGWFQGGLKGYLTRRRAEKARQVDHASANAVPALEADGDSNSTPGTPEDSPLVTPHTPRGSAILSLPALPTIPQLPNLGGIPTVSIPSFSDLTAALHAREHYATEFKDAVKNRWEEQRGRFADRWGGGAEGMGMNLDLGRLGLRRRGREGEVAIVGEDG